jgi:hypothetical protein
VTARAGIAEATTLSNGALYVNRPITWARPPDCTFRQQSPSAKVNSASGQSRGLADVRDMSV